MAMRVRAHRFDGIFDKRKDADRVPLGGPEDLLAPSLDFRPGRAAPQEAAADQDKPSRCQIVVDGPAWFMV